jgi:hypothetical protein
VEVERWMISLALRHWFAGAENRPMKYRLASMGAVSLVAVFGGGGTAWSQGLGLAGIHSWAKVGGRTCMVDHYHDGSGIGARRAQAERAAIRAWADFTAWEYGSSWGRFSNAASKSVNCTGRAGSWSCSVQARPCRSY